ncbi:MAG: TetR/AcrR family transcriptional regulator [Nevskia sp.]|nr:TetR/AcrR family transcriptional regulator [Nevskia sp.]
MKAAATPPAAPAGARKPQQQRSRDRVDAVLREAEALILEAGIDGFSIPALAERLGFPRATIYMFFPTPYTVFSELAQRHLSALEAILAEKVQYIIAAPDWREETRRLVLTAAQYYTSNPVASAVILGPLSESGYRAWEATMTRLGQFMRAMLTRRGLRLAPSEFDTAALAMEFGASSFRMSYFQHRRVTPAFAEAGAEVIVAFLAQRLHDANREAGEVRRPRTRIARLRR